MIAALAMSAIPATPLRTYQAPVPVAESATAVPCVLVTVPETPTDPPTEYVGTAFVWSFVPCQSI